MSYPVLSRRDILGRAAAGVLGVAAAHLLAGCDDPCPDCPIGWQPNVFAPVFYGWQDHGPAEGAPGNLRVYFPSLDGSPQHASIVSPGRGHYPLVLFLHGQCAGDSDHYRTWRLPESLARAGYVVAVPDRDVPTFPWMDDAGLSQAIDVVAWMRSQWRHRDQLMPPPATAIVGHSYGALLAGRIAASAPGETSAYVSIGGGWPDWPGNPPSPLSAVSVPSLFVWANDDGASDPEPFWTRVQRPKHRVQLIGGDHWDHWRRSPDLSPCGGHSGACDLIAYLTGDITTIFLSKYVPPERSFISAGDIPDDLTLPERTLTERQEFYAGAWLSGIRLLPATHCGMVHAWDTTGGSGSVSLGG